MLLSLLMVTGLANAGRFEVTLDAAREKMLEGDVPTAAGYIRAAELYAPTAGALIEGEQLGRIWMYQGMLVHRQDSSSEIPMQLWRQALTVAPDLAWDEEAYNDRTAQGLFEALRAEVRSRPQQDAQIPEAVGAAKLYVDGARIRAGETVREGLHLIQVECPDDQGTFGQWEDFSKKVKWLALCPSPVDTSVVVEEAEEEDEFGDFGPTFGGGGDSIAASTSDEDLEPLPPAPLPPPRARVNMPLLASAGVAALASGGMYIAALSSRKQFDDLGSTTIVSADDISALRQQTNTRVYISAGAGAAALGLYTAAFIQF